MTIGIELRADRSSPKGVISSTQPDERDVRRIFNVQHEKACPSGRVQGAKLRT